MDCDAIIRELRGCMGTTEVDSGRAVSLVNRLAEAWLAAPDLPRAISHPLGFLYIPLWRGDGQTLRLHIWSDLGQRRTPLTSPYHRHAWTLLSNVLAGSVTNELPMVVCTAQEAAFRLYDISGDGGVDVMKPTTITVRRLEDERNTYTAGQTYLTPAGVFHATTCPDGAFAATLCLVTTVEGASEVTLGPLRPTVITDKRELAEAGIVESTLRQLRAQLRQGKADALHGSR